MSTQTTASPRLACQWRVTVEAHDVGRWHVEAQTLQVQASDEREARVAAAREVHRQLGVPALQPWLRATYLRTTASSDGATVEASA